MPLNDNSNIGVETKKIRANYQKSNKKPKIFEDLLILFLL